MRIGLRVEGVCLVTSWVRDQQQDGQRLFWSRGDPKDNLTTELCLGFLWRNLIFFLLVLSYVYYWYQVVC